MERMTTTKAWRLPFLTDAALDAMPAMDLNKEIQRMAASLLARGFPVTLTAFGKPLGTMYPGGRTEGFGYPGRVVMRDGP